MTRYEYDAEASAAWHMDVVHEVKGPPPLASAWTGAMRRLNAIEDPLARKLLALHRSCGTGTGECDSAEDEPRPADRLVGWGCETVEVIAAHFNIQHP